ncbi:hypothetical protein ACQP2F_04835 [Actinoplanes sp. CA-030573]|uniref:hypothetical protein n=1 Tax=Actinoplanes sp. CA-030573 TaxID=3239898 RepID=UPI003D9239F2
MRASIGVAVTGEQAENCDAAELLRRADVAMYSAKRGATDDWVLHRTEGDLAAAGT